MCTVSNGPDSLPPSLYLPRNSTHTHTHTRKSEKFIPDLMLGKRGRPTFRRTTSMSGITVDVESMEAAPPPPLAMIGGEFDHMLSPRNLRKNYSGDSHVETADFLRSCGLCNRRLAPGRDIYMYR